MLRWGLLFFGLFILQLSLYLLQHFFQYPYTEVTTANIGFGCIFLSSYFLKRSSQSRAKQKQSFSLHFLYASLALKLICVPAVVAILFWSYEGDSPKLFGVFLLVLFAFYSVVELFLLRRKK